ncbi:MAG: hypothetical protein WC819_03610 [Parcubacteria group bacterium]|jgi:hypothetical protein
MSGKKEPKNNKTTCTKDLYWRYVPNYSGTLSADGTPDPQLVKKEIITKVFTAGKTYPLSVHVSESDCADADITIYALGDDGKEYPVLVADDILVRDKRLLSHFCS